MVQKVLNGQSLSNNTTKPKEVDYKGEDTMFNSEWYLNRYVDVAKSPNYINNAYKHYVDYGKKEKRMPIPRIPSNFVEKDYVELNGFQNIVGNGKQFSSGTEHFLMYGWKESQRKLFKGQPDTLPKGTEVKVLRGAKWGKGAGNPAKAGTELGMDWLYNINTCSVYVNDYKVNNGQPEYQLTLHKNGKISGVIWLWTGYVFVISDIVVPKATKKYYTVAKGDTLYSIANKCATTVEQVRKLNNLKSDVLSVGQKLRVK